VNLQFNPGVVASTNSGLRSDNTATAFSGATIVGTQTQDQANAGKAKALVTTIDADIAYVSEKLSSLGTGSNALSSHLTFMSKLQDSLDAGVGSLVDADLAKESARLQALQTKQQLGVQALSIANQSSGVLLGLFR
jgi:flagellin